KSQPQSGLQARIAARTGVRQMQGRQADQALGRRKKRNVEGKSLPGTQEPRIIGDRRRVGASGLRSLRPGTAALCRARGSLETPLPDEIEPEEIVLRVGAEGH